MKKLLIIICLVWIACILNAQNLENLSFGTDDTFEVLTWNIEWFPKNGTATVDSVSTIIQALDVDLLSIQEVDDTLAFRQMIDAIDGYDCYFESAWFAGLAYIYKTNVIQINDIYEIYTTSEYWNAFPRSPMVIDLNFMSENIFVINNHFKAGGDEILDFGNEYDEEYRRYMASELLKEYIDINLPEENVIVLGDLNDVLTDDIENNVFQMILDDSENYMFADMEIANGSSSGWSYPWWPSHIDHILITNELFDDFENHNSNIQTLQIPDFMSGGLNEYDEYISDHLPVALKLQFSNSDVSNNNVQNKFTLTNFPNPFNPTTTISFNLSEEDWGNIAIEIYNIKGQKIEELSVVNNQSSIVWNSKNQASGVYFYKLVINDKVAEIKKMILLK